jgi:hypothetical protein
MIFSQKARKDGHPVRFHRTKIEENGLTRSTFFVRPFQVRRISGAAKSPALAGILNESQKTRHKLVCQQRQYHYQSYRD